MLGSSFKIIQWQWWPHWRKQDGSWADNCLTWWCLNRGSLYSSLYSCRCLKISHYKKSSIDARHQGLHVEQLSLVVLRKFTFHLLVFATGHRSYRRACLCQAIANIYEYSFISQYILNTCKPDTGVVGDRDMMAVIELGSGGEGDGYWMHKLHTQCTFPL